MREVYVQDGPILLGRQGENQAQTVIWRAIAAQYAALYGEGTFQLMAQRCDDAAPYPVALTREGSSLVWTVSESDTAKNGVGRCELTYLVGGTVAKSKTWQTRVLASFTADGSAEPPEPAQSWVQEVLDAAAAAGKSAEAAADSADKAESASVHAPQIGADGAWETWDQASGAYVSTGVEAQGPKGEKGEDGAKKFIITAIAASDNTCTADHTVAEVFAAYNAGMIVECHITVGQFVGILPLVWPSESIVGFGATISADKLEMGFTVNSISVFGINTGSAETWAVYMNSFCEKDDVRQVPEYSSANDGQFLRVVNGYPVWQAVPNANGGSF